MITGTADDYQVSCYYCHKRFGSIEALKAHLYKDHYHSTQKEDHAPRSHKGPDVESD